MALAGNFGAYLTWRLRLDVTCDEARNFTLNIHAAGLVLDDAGKRIVTLMTAARRLEVAGGRSWAAL
jgi:ethanolamine ammonia-lyase small subunit